MEVFTHLNEGNLADLDQHIGMQQPSWIAVLVLVKLVMDALMISTWATQFAFLLRVCKLALWTSYFGAAASLGVTPRWILGSPDKPKPSKRLCRPTYSPGEQHRDDCFFACIARAVSGGVPTRKQVQRVRDVTALLWSQASPELLHTTARQAGHASGAEYLTATKGRGWGRIPDLLLW
eukprot:5270796-Amphidinium_carterae.1